MTRQQVPPTMQAMNWRRLLLGTRRLWIVSLVVLFAVIALYIVLLAVALKAGSF